MKFIRAALPSGWEWATWGLIGLAIAVHEEGIRRQVRREIAKDAWDEAAKEVAKDGVPGIS